MQVVESIIADPRCFARLGKGGTVKLLASRVLSDKRWAWVTVVMDEGRMTVITVFRESGFQKGLRVATAG